MKGPRSFRHETIAYERPMLPYRCGRGSMWRKPCWQGPDAAGGCQGRFECAPVRIGDRWECRRPKLAGGKCEGGPLPDGTCAHSHPPCAPRPSLRSLRGHLSAFVAVALAIALFLGLDPTASTVVNPQALDAGDLTSVHAGFTRERGCAACHAGHEKEALGWIAAAFSSGDASARCLECHDFPGAATRAHNAGPDKGAGYKEVPCARCHTEHKGAAAKIAQVPDFACANCHQKSFARFESGHTPFRASYPFDRPGAIHFDHSRHIGKYFGDPKVTRTSKAAAAFAAEAQKKCTACHSVEGATREVKPKPYAEICAACHEGQIRKAEFVLLEQERLTPAASFLLGMELEGDEEAATRRLSKLWEAMARGGTEALVELAAGGDAARRKSAEALFAGLPAQAVRDTGSAWAGRRPLPPHGAKEGATGWIAGDTADDKPALHLRAVHGDPALKAWAEALRTAAADGKDKDRQQIAAAALDQVLDPDGPGACGKCHGASLRAASPGALDTAWKRTGKAASPHNRYSHAPHLGLVDPDAGCRACHELNPASGYAKYFSSKAPKPEAYQSNFLGIRAEACVECHREGQVNAGCQVCHAYHLPHRFNLGFRTRGAKK